MDFPTLYAANVLEEGGSSGIELKKGYIRGDAERVGLYQYDKLMVHDLEKTLPSYTTSANQLLSSVYMTPRVPCDDEHYDYLILSQVLAYPIYDDQTFSAGKFGQFYSVNIADRVMIDENELKIVNSNVSRASSQSYLFQTNHKGQVYYGADGVAVTTTNIFQSDVTVSINNNNEFNIQQGSFKINGNSTFFSSSWWSHMTDIRLQYIHEIYALPKSSTVRGWTRLSNVHNMYDIMSGTPTLTPFS